MAGLQAVAEVEEEEALSPQSTRDAAMAASLAAAAVMTSGVRPRLAAELAQMR